MKYFITALILFILTGCQTLHSVNILKDKDAEIINKVQTVLNSTGYFIDDTLHVESLKGKVYISGYVRTIRHSDNATMLASQIKGVQSVENNIIVRR